MVTKINVQDARISAQIKTLHGALVEIVSVINEPQRDEVLLSEANVQLDRALFPLLVGINHFGPIGVVDLANRAGRDYTTISRQLAKLERLGLIERRGAAADRRVREAVVSPKGAEILSKIEAARDRIGRAIFSTWTTDDVDSLVKLMCRFADEIGSRPLDK